MTHCSTGNPESDRAAQSSEELVAVFNQQLDEARQEIYIDQYSMRLGELTAIYKDDGLILRSPATLTIEEKSRLIENLFFRETPLVLTVEPDKNDVWHVVDGDVNTLATVLELQGLLPGHDPLTLSAGKHLAILDGMDWDGITRVTSSLKLHTGRRVRLKRYPVEVLIFNKTH